MFILISVHFALWTKTAAVPMPKRINLGNSIGNGLKQAIGKSTTMESWDIMEDCKVKNSQDFTK